MADESNVPLDELLRDPARFYEDSEVAAETKCGDTSKVVVKTLIFCFHMLQYGIGTRSSQIKLKQE